MSYEFCAECGERAPGPLTFYWSMGLCEKCHDRLAKPREPEQRPEEVAGDPINHQKLSLVAGESYTFYGPPSGLFRTLVYRLGMAIVWLSLWRSPKRKSKIVGWEPRSKTITVEWMD